MDQWYYQVAGQVRGPVSLDELNRKAASGEIDRESLVRQGDEGRWQQAADVPGLSGWPIDASEVAEAAGGLEAVAAVAMESEPGRPPEEPQRGIRRSPLALHPCPDCGHMVSHRAKACPQCGRLFHESSMVIRYRGEHPVPVLAFFGILAAVFLVLSPVGVYVITNRLVSQWAPGGQAATIAVLATMAYLISMIVCSVLGGAVGRPRMAYITGLLLGLFFGPVGLFAAFAIDKRPQCCHCASRLDGFARECPFCHARLTWRVETSWY